MNVVSHWQGIGLHNVVELEPAEGGGHYLRRFPRHVRDALSPLGRMVSCDTAGVELRFVTDSPNFRVSLSSLPSVLSPYEHHHQDLLVFRGAFFHSHHRLTPGAINHINVVNIPGSEPFDALAVASRTQCGYSHRVWRIMLGRYAAALHSVDTYGAPRRPPQPDEVPARRWLAYGSSITHGASPTVHHLSYIYHAARAAQWDVCNQGLSGSCRCEPAVAEYLASRDDCDVISLELGVNMRGDFTPEQFRDRAASLVDHVCRGNPDRHVLLITIYPNADSPGFTAHPDALSTTRQDAFNAILRELTMDSDRTNLTLIEGSDILNSPDMLSVDLIHPNDYGHARMGMNMGERLACLDAAAVSASSR